jgi:uncharacterized protein YjiK
MKTSCAEVRRRVALLGVLLLLGCGSSAADTFTVGGFRYSTGTATEWLLPKALKELSGFATDAEGRLFAHDDEVAVIHQIDYAKGGIVKSFALGDPPVRGDFEGITLIDGRFALTTSDGTLFLAAEGDDQHHVPYETLRTGLGARCEIEGLEYVAPDRLLYFACKSPREAALKGRLTLLAWSPKQQREVPDRTISVPLERLGDLPGKGPVRPSDLALSPADGSFAVTAAGRRAIIALSPQGEVLTAGRVPDSKALRQIEAIAFTRDGTLLLGSEGGNERGRMRVYHVAE